jgi:hypothetical protein
MKPLRQRPLDEAALAGTCVDIWLVGHGSICKY